MATVDTIDQLDLSTAAHTAGISVGTLYRLNPALNQWSTHPKGPHRLMVPASDQEAIQTALSSIPRNIVLLGFGTKSYETTLSAT
ncbi:MAG: hypothetical protein Ct9H300mP8_07690 [Gammaproteobacteria bacterium]|nr:MAG: hypothetical protein Ct9H300mP8_07690 [Gammaproteobacteria bacterium]